MNKKLMYSIIITLFSMPIASTCMLIPAKYSTKGLTPVKQTSTQDVGKYSFSFNVQLEAPEQTGSKEYRINLFKHNSLAGIAKLPLEKRKDLLSSKEEINTNEDELLSGITLFAVSPHNAQKKIASHLSLHTDTSKNYFLHTPIKQAITKYGNAKHYIRNFQFTANLTPDHFLSANTGQLNMLRKLHDHFKDIKTGDASITITPEEYRLIQQLHPEMKSFHNKDSFFTARVYQTPFQKAGSIVRNTLGYAAVGAGLGTGASYALDCGNAIGSNVKEIITGGVKKVITDTILNPNYKEQLLKENGLNGFRDGFIEKFIDYCQDEENLSSDLAETLMHSTVAGANSATNAGADYVNTTIKNDIPKIVLTECEKTLKENASSIVTSNIPTPSLNNLTDGLVGGGIGGIVGLASGIWHNVIKNAPLFEETISKI